jgi:hypothetical protein
MPAFQKMRCLSKYDRCFILSKWFQEDEKKQKTVNKGGAFLKSEPGTISSWQMDIFREIANVGAGNAATALATLLDCRFLLNVTYTQNGYLRLIDNWHSKQSFKRSEIGDGECPVLYVIYF